MSQKYYRTRMINHDGSSTIVITNTTEFIKAKVAGLNHFDNGVHTTWVIDEWIDSDWQPISIRYVHTNGIRG
jgi:hypothetical protein